MNTELVREVPVAVEVAGVVTGSLSGAIHAVVNKADAIGTFAAALATGIGGGVLRDLLLGNLPPAALQFPRYLPAVVAASVLSMLFAGWLARAAPVVSVIDALLLGLWTLAGNELALAKGLPSPAVVFVGTMTATGGGVLRDLLTGQPPAIFRKGQLLVTAALLAATVHVMLVRATALPGWFAGVAALVVAAGLRLAALRWNLTAPDPVDLPSWWRSRRRPSP